MKKIMLARLWDRFIHLLRKYLDEHDLTQQELADKVGMQRSHLNALLNKSPDRPLSAYYLEKFIRRGIIKVKEIYDNDAENDREVDFWDQAKEAENFKLLAKIARIRKKTGTDMELFLEYHFPNV